jgi:hypothetical protein
LHTTLTMSERYRYVTVRNATKRDITSNQSLQYHNCIYYFDVEIYDVTIDIKTEHVYKDLLISFLKVFWLTYQ